MSATYENRLVHGVLRLCIITPTLNKLINDSTSLSVSQDHKMKKM